MQYKKFSELPLETSPDGNMYAPIVDPSELSVDDQNKRALLSSLSTAINFTQAGTGAVARTIQDKLRDVVSVKDFGAVGDGVTDDTAAIQACFESLKNAFPNWYTSSSADGPAAVFFPRGTYKITNTLNVPRGIKVYGDNARNSGGSQLYQATTGKYIFDLFGYEFIDGNGQTKREADQLITDLFFRSVGGGIRCVAADYPTTHSFSTGSLRFDRLYFLDINGGVNYACIYVNDCEAVRNTTFDYVQSPAIRTGGCGDFSGNVCWGGYVSDSTLGQGQHIIANCQIYAGDGSGSANTGGIVHIGSTGGASDQTNITASNCTFSKLVGGPGGHGVYSTNKLGSLKIDSCLFIDQTYPAITLTGTTHTASIANNVIKNIGSIVTTNVVSLGTVESGSFSNNLITGCTASPANLVKAASLSGFVVAGNSFVGNTRTTSDISIDVLIKSKVQNNTQSDAALVIVAPSIDATSTVQGIGYSPGSTTNAFVSQYTITRQDSLLRFSGKISRTTSGSFSANTTNLIGQISGSKWIPALCYLPAVVYDGTQYSNHVVVINNVGDVYLITTGAITWTTISIYLDHFVSANAAVV